MAHRWAQSKQIVFLHPASQAILTPIVFAQVGQACVHSLHRSSFRSQQWK